MQTGFVKTENEIDKIIPFIPEGDFYFTKGVEAFQKRKFDIALKWLKKAVEDSPNEPLYHCQMSIIYTEIGAYHSANQILTKIMSEYGDSYIDCYYLIANNYAHLGLLDDAKKYIETYLEKDHDGDFKEEAEELLLLLDFVDEEDEDEDNWEYEDEDELLIYQETAFFHLERQEWDKAIVLLKEMMTLYPDHIQARHEYSLALFFTGEQEKAIQLELEELEKDPQSLFCHTNLAVFYYERGEMDVCVKHIHSIKNVYPMHEQQKLRIANTLSRIGYYEEAYQRFKTLSKSQLKGHISYYQWFSNAAYHIGELFEASFLWKEGAQKFPILTQQKEPWVQQ